jgi:hypothetical protein
MKLKFGVLGVESQSIVQLKPEATEGVSHQKLLHNLSLFVTNINANIQEKLKPGASSPGAKQYRDQPTNRQINQLINGWTKSLIEALAYN